MTQELPEPEDDVVDMDKVLEKEVEETSEEDVKPVSKEDEDNLPANNDPTEE